MTRIKHPHKYGTHDIYKAGTPKGTPEYDESKLPPGFVACPVCGYPARTSHKDGRTVRSHHYQGSHCPGSGHRVENPSNGVYVPARVVYSAKAVDCPTCGAAVGELCVAVNKNRGRPQPYAHAGRVALHMALGSPAVLVEGEGEHVDMSRVAAMQPRKRVDVLGVPCPDCKVDSGTHCTTASMHVSRRRMAVRRFNHEVHGIEY